MLHCLTRVARHLKTAHDSPTNTKQRLRLSSSTKKMGLIMRSEKSHDSLSKSQLNHSIGRSRKRWDELIHLFWQYHRSQKDKWEGNNGRNWQGGSCFHQPKQDLFIKNLQIGSQLQRFNSGWMSIKMELEINQSCRQTSKSLLKQMPQENTRVIWMTLSQMLRFVSYFNNFPFSRKEGIYQRMKPEQLLWTVCQGAAGRSFEMG